MILGHWATVDAVNEERVRGGGGRWPYASLQCHVTQRQHSGQIQGGPKQSKLDNFCHKFVYCQPIFIILALDEIANWQPEDI